MKNTKMTRRRAQILEVIRESIMLRGFPPSIREIGAQVGLLSSSTVHCHLVALQQLGHISRPRGGPRAITLTEPVASRLHILEGLVREALDAGFSPGDWSQRVLAVL